MRWYLVLMLSFLVSCGGGGGSDETGTDTLTPDVAQDVGGSEDTAPDTSVTPPPDGVDYLIVTASDLLETAQEFKSYRLQTGHVVQLATVDEITGGAAGLSGMEIAVAIKEWVKGYWEKRDQDRPFYLLIVGDADPEDPDPKRFVPAPHWNGGWEGCDSDNAYGDMDMDHVPDLAVGRIPARSNDEGLSILDRIVVHETEYLVGPWNHRLHVYAGEGGFGEDVDFFIETIAQKGLESVPFDFDIFFAYRSPGSLWYYSPFEEKIEDFVTEGAVLVTYMGHGGGELDVPGDVTDLVVENRQAMYAFFACSTGVYPSHGWESESEDVMRLEDGPMAILVSTATTHPYANAVNAIEIEAAVFEERPETYGEAIRIMKWRSLYHTSDLRDMIDGFARTQIPEEEMADTIIDHMYSYNLLGDPAVRIRFPSGAVDLEAGDAVLGQDLEVSGTVSNLTSGTARVRLVCERAAFLGELTQIDDPQDPANEAAVQANWNMVMDHDVSEVELEIGAGGLFAGVIPVPDDIKKGNYHLTVYADDGTSDATGSLPIKVK